MFKLVQCFVLFGVGICATISSESSDPVVCIDNGCIRGKSFKGNINEFEGFLGIPFAKPPVGDLRLKDPQPIDEKWSVILNATEEKEQCMQKNYLIPNPQVSGVEDCLYLYVYRPKNINRVRDAKLPVIVYIHGGGFFAGTAGPSLTGADYFMDTEEVIFVTMHYRLGPLGFLSTGDENMSGNFGLKDQSLAIKWVKENIHAFGGNSSNIVLMGQSAGASSAHLHMMSSHKWSRDLFNKVILLSGNGNGPYAYVIQDPLQQARNFAKSVGIRNNQNLTAAQLASRLRNSKPELLVNAQDDLKIWSVDPLTISRPVVEDCNTSDGFLCEDPVVSWRKGDFAKVSVLTGFMDGDGGVRALSILENKNQLNELNRKFDDLMPKLMEIDSPSEGKKMKFLQKIKNRYFKGKNVITDDTSKNLIRLYTERSFITPLYNTLEQMVLLREKVPAYVYKFSLKGPLSYSIFYTGGISYQDGPVHCDELVYLLKSPLLFPDQDFDPNSKNGIFRSKFVKFFTDFSTSDKPLSINGQTVDMCEAKNRRSALKCSYVEFGKNFSVSFNGSIDESIADFWNEIDPNMIGTGSSKYEVSSSMKIFF